MRPLLLAMLAGAVLPACSLVVADLRPGQCERFDDCEPLNDRDRLDARSCELWTCDRDDRVCRRRARDRDGDGFSGPYPAGEECTYDVNDCDDDDAARASDLVEECDGVDNDCDLIVDEATPAASTELFTDRGEIGPLASDFGPPSVGFPARQQPASRTAITSSTGPSDTPGDTALLEDGGAIAGVTWQTACDGGARAGCFSAAGCGGTAISSCDFAEPSIDHTGTEHWVAAVNAGSCAEGEVRVGVLAGPVVRIDGDTETGLPECASGPARRPSIASLTDAAGVRLALISHHGEALTSTRSCGTGSTPVRASAVRQDVTGLDVWSGPFDLGATASTSPAAIAAIEPRGWVVAFGGDTGGATLVWVPSSLGASSATVITTVGTEPTSEVRLAAHERAGTIDLAVLRQTGCDAGAIVLDVLRFDPASPSGATVATTTLAASGRAPSITRVDDRMVMEGYARGGSTTDPLSTAGWIASWSDAAPQGDLYAQRVLLIDGEPIGAPLVIAGEAGRQSWIARSDTGVADLFVVQDRAAGTFVRALGVYCRTPASL